MNDWVFKRVARIFADFHSSIWLLVSNATLFEYVDYAHLHVLKREVRVRCLRWPLEWWRKRWYVCFHAAACSLSSHLAWQIPLAATQIVLSFTHCIQFAIWRCPICQSIRRAATNGFKGKEMRNSLLIAMRLRIGCEKISGIWNWEQFSRNRLRIIQWPMANIEQSSWVLVFSQQWSYNLNRLENVLLVRCRIGFKLCYKLQALECTENKSFGFW